MKKPKKSTPSKVEIKGQANFHESLTELREKLRTEIPPDLKTQIESMVKQLSTKARSSDASLETLHFLAAGATQALFLLSHHDPLRVSRLASKFLTWPVKIGATPMFINAVKEHLQSIKLSENRVSSLPFHNVKGRFGSIAKRWIEEAIQAIDNVRIAYCQADPQEIEELNLFECACLELPKLSSDSVEEWWVLIHAWVEFKTDEAPQNHSDLSKLASRRRYEYVSVKKADIYARLNESFKQMCSKV
jgi:hypothetical protein